MEKEPDSFFEMIRSGYLDLARDNKDRFVVLDGSQSPEVIECEIWNYLNKKYGIEIDNALKYLSKSLSSQRLSHAILLLVRKDQVRGISNKTDISN